MKRLLIYLILFILLLWGGMVKSADIKVNGYYKLFFTGFKMPGYRLEAGELEEPAIGAVNNRLRLKLSFATGKWLAFEAAYDFSPRIQDPMLFQEGIFFAAIDPVGYRVEDFSDRIYPAKGEAVSSFGIFHNLDRCFFTIKTSVADIFIGRQAIAWGSGHFINPTDVIAPFTFNELDTEERRGVDAVRIRIPLGMMDELDLGYVLGKNFKFQNSAFYVRGKTYFMKTDAALLLMGFRENLLIGLDFTRAIGGAGAWIEAAYVDPDFFNKDKNTQTLDEKSYFRASVGMDYTFTGKLYGFFEYHFNSAGKKKPGDYTDVFSSTAFTEGAAYLMGQHYLNLGMTYQVSALIPFTGLVFINLNDGSVTLSPMLEYNIAENIYLGGGAYIGIGKRPGIVDLSSRTICFHSEFGAYPAMIYTSFRVYF
jgi:opacity protein-like surface antigen